MLLAVCRIKKDNSSGEKNNLSPYPHLTLKGLGRNVGMG